jgi:hypothetical protein
MEGKQIMTTDPKATLAAEEFAASYDVLDLDLRGELERTEIGWNSSEIGFEKLITKVIELLRIAITHAHEAGAEYRDQHPSREVVERIVMLSQERRIEYTQVGALLMKKVSGLNVNEIIAELEKKS